MTDDAYIIPWPSQAADTLTWNLKKPYIYNP